MSAQPNERIGWLARWENRQQAKFDRERAEEPALRAEYEAHNVEVTGADGRQYLVRAAKRGTWIAEDICTCDPTVEAAARFLAAFGRLAVWLPTLALRRWRGETRAQWTVCVVRYGRWLDADRFVSRENLQLGADECDRVAELADLIRSTGLPTGQRAWRLRP